MGAVNVGQGVVLGAEFLCVDGAAEPGCLPVEALVDLGAGSELTPQSPQSLVISSVMDVSSGNQRSPASASISCLFSANVIASFFRSLVFEIDYISEEDGTSILLAEESKGVS